MASKTTPKTKPTGPKKRQSSSSSTAALYLLVYNAVSLGVWSILLARVISWTSSADVSAVYPKLYTFALAAEMLAVLDLVHAATGLVRASPVPTALQVSGRLAVIWGLLGEHRCGYLLLVTKAGHRDARGEVWRNNAAFALMLAAWSVADVVRFAYFVAAGLRRVPPPPWLVWARYNLFVVLYPLGIGAEAWLVAGGFGVARRVAWVCGVGVAVWLALYVPGAFMLMRHMLKQRAKVSIKRD